MGQRLRCLIVASHFVFLAGMAGAAAQPLSPSDQQLLREAHAGRNVGSAATNKKLGDALQLARKLGQENNNDAIPFLIELGDRGILFAFTETYTAPATQELEALVIKYLRDPALDTCSVAYLIKKYQSRALYEALLSVIRSQIHYYEDCVRAIVLTDMPGIEPELTELLPHLGGYHPANYIASFLVARQYEPAEPALIAWLRRTPPESVEAVASIILKLNSPGILNALVQRLADLRSLPPGRTLDSSAGLLIRVIPLVTPRVKMNRSLLSQEVIQAFPPECQARIVAMMKERDSVEKMAEEITPDNLAHWIGQHRNDEVRNFIKRGADVDAAGKSSSDRPLITAVKYGNWEAMRLLLEAGADPNVKDWVGDTPLKLVAARKAHDESLEVPTLAAAKFLIAKGADVSAASSDTRTPLHVATGLRCTKMVILLVESGANVNAEATDMGLHGLTPTLIAQDQGYDDLAAYLRSKGGTVNQVFVTRRAAQRAFTNIVGPFLYSH